MSKVSAIGSAAVANHEWLLQTSVGRFVWRAFLAIGFGAAPLFLFRIEDLRFGSTSREPWTILVETLGGWFFVGLFTSFAVLAPVAGAYRLIGLVMALRGIDRGLLPTTEEPTD